MPPTYVVVSGVPGAGKTTVSRSLAEQLGVSYLGPDDLMEAIFNVVGIRDHRWARTVSQAAMKSLFELAAHCETVVLDAWWERWGEPLRALPGTFIEIFCDCSPPVAAARARLRKWHPGHFDELNDWSVAGARQSEPLGLGGPVLRIDTNGIVDISAVVHWVNEAMAQSAFPNC